MGRNIDNDIETYMKSIKTDIEELKNRQLIGADNLVLYQLASLNSYDYTFTMPGVGTRRLEFTYYAAIQDWFFYNVNVTVFVGATFATAVPVILEGGGILGNIAFGESKKITIPIIIDNSIGAATYWIKFYVLASDAGTGTVDLVDFG